MSDVRSSQQFPDAHDWTTFKHVEVGDEVKVPGTGDRVHLWGGRADAEASEDVPWASVERIQPHVLDEQYGDRAGKTRGSEYHLSNGRKISNPGAVRVLRRKPQH